MADFRDTLLLCFSKGLAREPSPGERWLFLNADLLPAEAREFVPMLACEQGFRPIFLALRKAGLDVLPSRSGETGFAGALMHVTRSRQLNERLLARAHDSVSEGGAIVVAGSNDDGAKSLRKYVQRHCGAVESLSKHHAIGFVLQRGAGPNPFPLPPNPPRGAFEVAPGMFSADGPDEGSRILAEHFDGRICGRVADLGAGWGYLGTRLLSQSPEVAELHCFEADHASLEAARINLAASEGDRRILFDWLDVTSEPLPAGFDWVVMNPPFHTTRAAEPALGNAFIAAAASALGPGGRLLMVANRNLPYEHALGSAFGTHTMLAESRGYKVIEARKG
jgi:16S rRNA (guanine1207-N2)-methyltransferase